MLIRAPTIESVDSSSRSSEAAGRDASEALWPADVIDACDPESLSGHCFALTPTQRSAVGRGDKSVKQAGRLDDGHCLEPGDWA